MATGQGTDRPTASGDPGTGAADAYAGIVGEYAGTVARIADGGIDAAIESLEREQFRRISELRPLAIPVPERACALPSCGKLFTPARSHQYRTYCSEACRQAAYYRRKKGKGA